MKGPGGGNGGYAVHYGRSDEKKLDQAREKSMTPPRTHGVEYISALKHTRGPSAYR